LGDSRTHRGPHPEDERLFGEAAVGALRAAVADLCWLLSRGYVTPSALKLVGDRYRLTTRQRIAVGRCACSEAALARRSACRVDAEELRGRPLWVDGYNVLTTVEAALGGGVILPGRDGAYRDMASMHGSYRKVAETLPALALIGQVVDSLQVSQCVWYLDRPVSNSGRLKQIILSMAAENGWPWRVELVADPDTVLRDAECAIATADSGILDRCCGWFNLARAVLDRGVREAWVLGLRIVN
jgi:hypothetical protein